MEPSGGKGLIGTIRFPIIPSDAILIVSLFSRFFALGIICYCCMSGTLSFLIPITLINSIQLPH